MMEEVEEPTPSLADLLQATARSRNLAPPDLSSPAAAGYLDHLLALPLQSLVQEASVIVSEAGTVENELTNLCYREYPTFISVHNCSSAVTSAFDDFSSSLGRLLDAVPALEEECRTFARSTAGVQKARAKAALVQEHQDKLFDLLEIPQLMDTCVRNGYYQEALELSAHTNSMVQRYPGVELVQDVAKEVDNVLQLMLAQLLALLRESIKLPALVKTVGYLRRLGTINEPELSLAFLVSRLSNFKTHLVGLERDRADPARYVRKYVDLFREHVFDIISQFTAIFLDNNPHATNSPAAAQLASFVEQCVSDLVALVSANVPKMTNDTASLSSILVQIGYCSLAFARVGLDFAPLVIEPFSSAVLLAFSETIDTASMSFTSTLAKATKSANSPSQVVIAPEYLPVLLAADSPANFVKWDGTHDHLPTDLARFPPLAILVNAHLSALNSLRLLAPLHLYPRLASIQSKSLLACTHGLAQYVRNAAALSDPSVSEPAHSSSERRRAALIRRNSETQMTPESRAQRRKETHAICVAFATTWANTVCPLISDALRKGIYDGAPQSPLQELTDALASLNAWAADQVQSDDKNAKETGSRKANGSDAVPEAEAEAEPALSVAEPESAVSVDTSGPAAPVDAVPETATPEPEIGLAAKGDAEKSAEDLIAVAAESTPPLDTPEPAEPTPDPLEHEAQATEQHLAEPEPEPTTQDTLATLVVDPKPVPTGDASTPTVGEMSQVEPEPAGTAPTFTAQEIPEPAESASPTAVDTPGPAEVAPTSAVEETPEPVEPAPGTAEVTPEPAEPAPPTAVKTPELVESAPPTVVETPEPAEPALSTAVKTPELVEPALSIAVETPELVEPAPPTAVEAPGPAEPAPTSAVEVTPEAVEPGPPTAEETPEPAAPTHETTAPPVAATETKTLRNESEPAGTESQATAVEPKHETVPGPPTPYSGTVPAATADVLQKEEAAAESETPATEVGAEAVAEAETPSVAGTEPPSVANSRAASPTPGDGPAPPASGTGGGKKKKKKKGKKK